MRLNPQSAKTSHIAHLTEQGKKGMHRGRETKQRHNSVSSCQTHMCPHVLQRCWALLAALVLHPSGATEHLPHLTPTSNGSMRKALRVPGPGFSCREEAFFRGTLHFHFKICRFFPGEMEKRGEYCLSLKG